MVCCWQVRRPQINWPEGDGVDSYLSHHQTWRTSMSWVCPSFAKTCHYLPKWGHRTLRAWACCAPLAWQSSKAIHSFLLYPEPCSMICFITDMLWASITMPPGNPSEIKLGVIFYIGKKNSCGRRGTQELQVTQLDEIMQDKEIWLGWVSSWTRTSLDFFPSENCMGKAQSSWWSQ